MAPSAKFYCFLFLVTLFSSLQIHARESQFFSKVTHYNSNAKDSELPSKEEHLSKTDQEPSFMPETENGYGLYGHESGQLPPTTTTTTYSPSNLPYKSGEPVYRVNPSTTNTNYYYNKNAYEAEQQGLGGTSLVDRGYTTSSNRDKFYNSGNRYSNQYSKQYNPTGTGGYATQQQGMSDTRFLENGKYYYDVNKEKYYGNGYDNSRVVDSRNQYNNRGSYNPYEYNNSVGKAGYQNQEEYQESEEEEFEP